MAIAPTTSEPRAIEKEVESLERLNSYLRGVTGAAAVGAAVGSVLSAVSVGFLPILAGIGAVSLLGYVDYLKRRRTALMKELDSLHEARRLDETKYQDLAGRVQRVLADGVGR